jgi:hypothetical protein
VYLTSLRGDVSFWDTADLQTVPYILGIPYPTGFPGFVLLGWVWSHAFAIGNVAWRFNVLDAIASAGAAAAVAALLITLGAATAIGFAAALVYALAAVPWSHATYVDVHPIGFCAVAWAAVYAVRWSRNAAWFDAVACVVAVACALAIDNSTVLALPGLALIYLTRRPPLRNTLVLSAAAAVALVAAYAYLPLRSAAVTAARIDPTLTLGLAPGRPFWDDGHPSTWAGFVRVVTGSDFSPHTALTSMFSSSAIHGLVENVAPHVESDLGGFFPWLALFGAVMLWWRAPLILAGMLLLGLLPVLFASAYPVESEATRYYLPMYFGLAVAAGYGTGVLDAGMRGMQRIAALAVVGLAWIALLAGDVTGNTALFAQLARNDGSSWIKRVVSATPANAIVVAPWTYATTLAYGSYVLHTLGNRIVVTADAHEYQERYRSWLPKRPIVVVSDDPVTFERFHLHELDDGSPHMYALR